ncbi:MAG: branched-chain amino acid transporter AzlD, partial [Gammaproteobacteria bacterium]|nr:branched-chain amino acid transporter AzlD [Gammaproteobacteria bacterium]
EPPHGAPELIAALLTLSAHLLWRNALLSLFAGTAFYMYAVQSSLFL